MKRALALVVLAAAVVIERTVTGSHAAAFWIFAGAVVAALPWVPRPESNALWTTVAEGRRRRVADGVSDRGDVAGLWLSNVARAGLVVAGLFCSLYGISLAL
jgi:hypothetical protein